MNNKSNIYAHVGFQKTGSSFLQKNYFSKHPDLSYYSLTKRLTHELHDASHKDKILISNENLIGNIWGYSLPPDINNKNRSWLKDNDKLFKNLSSLIKVEGVILGVRDHLKLIISLYKQYLHMGGEMKFNEFFDIEGDNGMVKKDDLLIAKRIELIKEYFTDNILVYNLNELKNISNLENKLNKFLGIENYNLLEIAERENVGVEGKNVERLRLLNKFNNKLIKTPFLPSLNFILFQKLKLTPRDICQTHLARWYGHKFVLNKSVENKINEFYKNDKEYLI